MKSLNSNKIIPFIIICFCLLIFIGILRNKKAEKINNIMENFINNENFINKNIEHFDDQIPSNYPGLDSTFIDEYMSGYWTTPDTTLNNEGFATQLMKVELKNKKGTITLPKIEGNKYYNGISYNILISKAGEKDGSIVGVSNESQYTLSINYFIISKENNNNSDDLLFTTNVPLGKIIFIDKNNDKSGTICSYKVPENAKIEPSKLKDIIQSKSFNCDEIKDIYNIKSYIKIIGDYQFLNDSVSFSFGLNYNSSPQILNYYNIIKNSYASKLLFRIAREFIAPNGSTIRTQASKIYTLEAFKKIGNNITIPSTININAPINDINLNNINYNEYIPKALIVYFYKTTNTSTTYNFNNSAIINNSKFKFNNNGINGSTMFSTNNIDTNNLNTLTQNNNANHTIKEFIKLIKPHNKNINEYINDPIKISFLDLCKFL